MKQQWYQFCYEVADILERIMGWVMIHLDCWLVRYSAHEWYQRMAYHLAAGYKATCDMTDKANYARRCAR